MKTALILGALAVLLSAVNFYSSFCPSRSFAIGSVIGVAGSAACHEADIKREADENPTDKVLKGGI